MQQNKGKGNGNVKKEANPKEKKKFKEFLHKFFKIFIIIFGAAIAINILVIGVLF